MDFDFYQLYKDYSNIDLLKIVRQPANYQFAAVAAAEDILRERQISAEEISVVDQYFQQIENSEKSKKEKIDSLTKPQISLSRFYTPVKKLNLTSGSTFCFWQ